jgi:NAD-dependent dihydropyrimidine dehydrogenase PreA subunit/flavodoxin
MYFSATDTTKKVVTGIAKQLSECGDEIIDIGNIDFTLPENRKKSLSFTEDDLVIVGVPVYAGRVPNVLLKFLGSVSGNGALAVAVVVYGNRHYDDALVELQDILAANGFSVIAAGAFVGKHSFSKILAKNRPDEKDMAAVNNFANQIYRKIESKGKFNEIVIKGSRPYRKYYVPRNENNEPTDIRKVAPKTNNNCINCKLCASHCPMGSIDYEDPTKLNGICIKCCACIKKCPTNAKYFEDENYLRHKHELEINFANRREPEIFM